MNSTGLEQVLAEAIAREMSLGEPWIQKPIDRMTSEEFAYFMRGEVPPSRRNEVRPLPVPGAPEGTTLGQFLMDLSKSKTHGDYTNISTPLEDNYFSDEWKRQVGYYGHNPIIDDRTPLATADYRPDFRFLDQWWRKYKPPVLEEEEELEEEKPVEKVLEEIISEGGGDRVASDGFVDMRDPEFMGRSGYPGMKDGQWLGGNLGWKDAAQMLGNMRGGLGGLLSGMLNGSLSTYGSPSGKNAIGNIADALGVNKDTALAEIGRALGYSDPATAKRDTSILGQLFGGKPGTPNVKGMMAGTLAGYPNTWNNPTFSNIVNERATIAGVLGALADAAVNKDRAYDFGDWGKIADGTWGAPDLISEFNEMMQRNGLVDGAFGKGLSSTHRGAVQSVIDSLMNDIHNPLDPSKKSTMTIDEYKGYIKGIMDAGGGEVAENLGRGIELNAADAGRIANSLVGGLTVDNIFDKFAEYQSAKSALTSGGYANKSIANSKKGSGIGSRQDYENSGPNNERNPNKEPNSGGGEATPEWDGPDDPGQSGQNKDSGKQAGADKGPKDGY